MHIWQGPPLSTYSCLRRHCGVDLAAATYEVFLQYSRHACCYSAPHLAPDTLPILSVIFGTRVTVLESKCARTDLKEIWMNTGACAAQGCRSQGDCRAVQNLHQLRYDETSAAAAATAASIWKELYIQSVGRLLQRLILRAGLLLGGRNKIASMEQLTSLGAYRQERSRRTRIRFVDLPPIEGTRQ
jgi:hypothetical protein